MLENFSEQALKAVMYAQEEARQQRSSLVEPDHVLLGLLRDPETLVSELLRSKQIEPQSVRNMISRDPQARKAPLEVIYSDAVQTLFRLAENEARSFGMKKVDTDHLLLGLVETGEGQTPEVLKQVGLNLSHLRWNILRLRYTKKNAAIRTASLDRYSLDLTARREQGLEHQVMEWEPMVERLIQYLGMQHKHHVLMVGEHGVGKTALIHALNQYILDSRIYQRFAHCRVVFLYVDKMLAEAGTTDERLYEVTQAIMSEIRQSQDIILVIENIHQLFLAQKKELEFVITQQLLTLLEDDATFCIATTTPRFFHYLEERTTIRHLFQIFEVPEPPAPFCQHILQLWRERLEAHHQLQISPEALEMAVRLSGEKSNSRRPEASLALLDLAASRKSWQQSRDRREVYQAERRLKYLVEQRALVAEQSESSPAARKVFEEIKQDILRTETQLQRYQLRLQQDPLLLEGEDLLQVTEHPGKDHG